MPRLLVVSNRLPVTVSLHHGEVVVEPSPGGLATGLKGPHERSGGLWLGWPGDTSSFSPEQMARVATLLGDLRTVPLHLTASEVSRFYDGFANGVIWPLFHYLPDRLPLQPRGWDAYRKVNQRFADHVVAHHKPGDLVWVNDYQLMLVPGMLRKQLPDATIGFFLHIPFPASDLFRILPWRAAILEGLLGADLIGFHTFSYLNHFASAVLRILGRDVAIDHLNYDGREVRLGVFPMGVDATAISADADRPELLVGVAALRENYRGRTMLLGIDRLDYTKGIPRRLLAMERLFERNPSLSGGVQLLQIAVPSRAKVEAYAEFRRQADELVGRINGIHSTVSSPSIQYLYRSFSMRKVIELYRAADIMVVTPLRDGMNLVAKEFVAARNDEDGVLILSEFAGAAAELCEAITVNPYDLDGVADAIHVALRMSPEERKSRMQALRRRVFSTDVHQWVAAFLEALESARSVTRRTLPPFAAPNELSSVVRRLATAEHLALLLDYDGTLVPFASAPHLAAPDEELIGLLRALSARRGTELHIVSGRDRETLEQWFGHLNVGLHAEHGFWSREIGSHSWISLRQPPEQWKKRIRPILEEFVRRAPGSMIEEKSASLAWHYRAADPEQRSMQSRELRAVLAASLHHAPLHVLLGAHVIEVRLQDVHKGLVVSRVLNRRGEKCEFVIIGDDLTDEDMFAALPPSAVGIHVGPSPSRAGVRVKSPPEVRALLKELLEFDANVPGSAHLVGLPKGVHT